jgi:hypothetical protein
MNFEREGNIKKSVGLGLYRKRVFNDGEELNKWLLQNFTAIMEVDYIPDPFPTMAQFDKLRNFVSKYLVWRDSSNDLSWEATETVKNFFKDLHEIRGTMDQYDIHVQKMEYLK